MIQVKMFTANGGKITGLIHAADAMCFAIPKQGDYVAMGAALTSVIYKVEEVVFQNNENAVRLVVTKISI